MAFNVTGVTTVTDVRDGISAPVVVLSNENHTFVADSSGAVSDLTGFQSDVQVFLGQTTYTSTSDAIPTGTNFRIGTPNVSPAAANISVTVNRGTGRITITDSNTTTTGFVDGNTTNEFTISIPVTVAGITGTVSRTISFSKSIGGNAPITRIASNTQTVSYGSTGSITRTGNIVIQATFVNNTSGTVTWQERSGSGNFATLSGSGITFATFDSVALAQATITPTAFNSLLGSDSEVTFRVTRGGQFDQITIARINDGAAAISVVVTPSSGSTILRSDTDAVVLRADVYQAGTLLSPGADWTYQWAKDGTNLTALNQVTQTGATQQSGEGFNLRSLRVEGDGIADNAASLFSVNVVDPT